MTPKQTSDRYVSDILRKLTSATETSLFAMFKGYMDESGINNKDLACTVAGFVGGQLTCDRAEELWRELVQPIGSFHAKEFFRRANRKMTGIYEGIGVTDAENCVIRLVEMLKSSGLEPIGMAINANIFRSLSDDEKRWMNSAELYGKNWSQQPKHPYFACFHYCITQANQFTPHGEKVFPTFDEQATYGEKAKETFNKLKNLGGKWGERLGTIAFLSKQEVVLLQAADLLTYSIGKMLNTGKLNVVVQSVLDNLGFNKDYIRAMDVKSMDVHLKDCPFRKTFWKGLSEPDLMEQVAEQGHTTLTYKGPEGYLTHHLKANKVRIIDKIMPQPFDGRNLTVRRDDSTK